MILHPDRYSPGASPVRNGVVIHDSEGQEGTLPWGQLASAQLVGLLQSKGDRPSPSRPGGVYGSGYQAVAKEDGTYVTIADDTVGPYHAGGGFNPNWWSICVPGRASQTREQWLGDVSRLYIRAVARYVVDRWLHDNKVWPLTFVTGAALKARRADLRDKPCGYTSHAQVTLSKLVKTDHTDPGPSFPWDILALDIEALTATHPPTPELPAEEPEPMQLGKKDGKAAVWIYDRKTRQHVTNEPDLDELIPLYGAVLALSATQDLAALGKVVLGTDPGDV